MAKMRFKRAGLGLGAALLALGTLVNAGAAQAQYYPYPPAYYPPPPPSYYPPPAYYPAPQPYYTPTPRASRGVAERCATQFGTCEIGPTRPGRNCNCFFPGSGKIPGVAVR